jgi:hypothetical protein
MKQERKGGSSFLKRSVLVEKERRQKGEDNEDKK